MDIIGTITHILPEVSGTSKAGNTWRKQEFVLETKEQFPKKICFNAWGEKIDQFGIAIGDMVTASVDLESREYNGRWFTEVKAWKVQKGVDSSGQNAGGSALVPPPIEPLPPIEGDDELPF